MEDEERSHRGEAIGRAVDQCVKERKNQTEMKKSVVCNDILKPGVMMDFSSVRAAFFIFWSGNFNNMLLIYQTTPVGNSGFLGRWCFTDSLK